VHVHRTVLGVQARNEVCCGSKCEELSVSTLSPLRPRLPTYAPTSICVAMGQQPTWIQ
jgi:hypothetical protein